MHIIGIAGKAGSGKNTFGGLLAGALVGYGYTAAVDAFAVGVKGQARRVCGWDGNKDEFGRRLLQQVGTFMRETQGEGYWTSALLTRHAGVSHDFLIVCDVRYRIEVAAIRHWRVEHQGDGSTIIRVDGRGGLEGTAAEHSSETDLDGCPGETFDLAVDNSGTWDALALAAMHLAAGLVSERYAKHQRNGNE